jgi:hypothetical protein
MVPDYIYRHVSSRGLGSVSGPAVQTKNVPRYKHKMYPIQTEYNVSYFVPGYRLRKAAKCVPIKNLSYENMVIHVDFHQFLFQALS